MRNLSFALTTKQIRERTKTVTRRKGGWWERVLKPGMKLCAVERSRGIKAGGLVRLCVIRVVDVRVERLGAIRDDYEGGGVEEAEREGFPGFTGWFFIGYFMSHMGGDADQLVTRIEFEYVEQLRVPCEMLVCMTASDEFHSRALCRCHCHGEEAFR